MDLSDLESALALPFAADTSLDTVAAGVLAVLATAATPLAGVALAGYVVRLVRADAGRTAALPTFADARGLLGDGARLTAAVAVSHLPAVALGSAALSAAGLRATSLALLGSPAGRRLLGLSPLDAVALLCAGAAALGGSYLAAAATVAVAREDSLAAATSPTRTLATDPSFVPVVAAAALVVGAGGLVGALVAPLPVVGAALSAAATFLTVVVAAVLLGRGGAAVLDAAHPGSSAERDSEPTRSADSETSERTGLSGETGAV